MIPGPILRIGVGMDHMIDCLQKKRIWKLISNLGQSMVSKPSSPEAAGTTLRVSDTRHSVEAQRLLLSPRFA